MEAVLELLLCLTEGAFWVLDRPKHIMWFLANVLVLLVVWLLCYQALLEFYPVSEEAALAADTSMHASLAVAMTALVAVPFNYMLLRVSQAL